MADCWTVGAAYSQDMIEMPIERAQEHLSEVVEEAERAGEVV
jgi:hypothetical protein